MGFVPTLDLESCFVIQFSVAYRFVLRIPNLLSFTGTTSVRKDWSSRVGCTKSKTALNAPISISFLNAPQRFTGRRRRRLFAIEWDSTQAGRDDDFCRWVNLFLPQVTGLLFLITQAGVTNIIIVRIIGYTFLINSDTWYTFLIIGLHFPNHRIPDTLS